MKRLGPIVMAVAMTMLPGVAAAPPPAPVPTPPALEQPVDGYDMRIPYQRWRYWVERQKGQAIEALLAKPEALPGERTFGAPLSWNMSSDFGVFLRADVRAYCRPAPDSYRPDRDTCHYRLRRATVPAAADGSGGDNPVARWMRDTFDAQALAAHFRRSGLGPQTDWWMADMARMFAPLPSAVPILTEHAEVVRIDSRDCPALATALEALERTRTDRRLDLGGVGEDAPMYIPPPHGGLVTYRLSTLLPDAGGYLALEGAGPAMDKLVGPVLAAAEACEPGRR